MTTFPAYLVRGDDLVLVRDAVQRLVHELVGDADASLVVEEIDRDDSDDVIAAVVDAAQTPPFLTDRRVVLLREVGRFTSDQVSPLVTYLSDPLETSSVVIAGGGGQTPRSLADAVRRVGHVVDAGVPHQARQRHQWIAERIKGSGLRLEREAVALIADHLGEDVGRLGALLDLLEAAYGEGATVGGSELQPFLGDAGGVPPWALTDAIDQGQTEEALSHLRRQLEGGARHPLQILAGLHGHYERMLRLDGAGVDEAGAAQILGLTSSTFPAKKALEQGRRLGTEGVGRAIALLAEADLDLRGARGLPGEVILEVLVARLSRLRPGAGRPGRRSGGRKPASRH
jgi:DNA polymerase-3 subunit delta